MLLQIHDLHKDYQLTKNIEYMYKMSKNINKIQKHIDKNGTYNIDSLRVFNAYKNGIYKLLSLEENIRLQQKEFNNFIKTLEPTINQFQETIKNYIKLLAMRTMIFSIATIFFLVLFIFAINKELFEKSSSIKEPQHN
jgi:hypothetical protein